MRFSRKRGVESVKFRIFIPDNSVTNGSGKTGLTSASTNLAISFSRAGDNGGTEITGANIVPIATIGTWVSIATGKIGFAPVDTTKFPGLYEIHVANDCAAYLVGDLSEAVYWNIYETTTTALNIGPNMVLIPLSKVDILNGESDLVSILGTFLTETAGQIAIAFKKFFDKGSPTGTINSLPDAIPGANMGLTTTDGIAQIQTVNLANGTHGGAATVITLQIPIEANIVSETNHDFTTLQKTSLNASTPASVQNIPATGTGFTALGDARIANLDAAISTRTKPADTQAAVTTVTNLINAPTVGDFTTTMKTSINTEMLDVIATDTIAEMTQGEPPAAPTIKQILNYLYRRLRNKNETTATTNKVYDNAGATVLFKETHSDDGTTFTKGKFGTGA